MARVIQTGRSIWCHCLCIAIGCLVAVGCGGTTSGPDSIDGPSVRVMYKGEPLADVQVRLYESLDGPVLAQSITRPDGKAYFTQVPSPEPAEYCVTVESLADGGWILDPTIGQKLSKNTKLDPLESAPQQELVIPDGAVKPLSP